MRSLIVSLLALVSWSANSQSKILDSLASALDNAKEDTIKVALLNQYSFRVLKYQPEKSQEFANRALALALRLKYEIGIGNANNNLAVYHLLKGKADVALSEAFNATKIAERINDVRLLANSHAILGSIYHNQLNYEKALLHLREASKLNVNLNDVLIRSRVYNSLGLIDIDRKKYDSAMYFFTKSLNVMEDAHEDYRVPEVINNIGLVYTRQHQDSKAKEYYLKSLQAAQLSNNRRAQAIAIFNLGNTILSERKYAEAELLLLQSLALSKESGEARIIGASYMALGQLKNETGKFDDAHTYISAFYEQRDSLQNIERLKKIDELEILYETEKKEHMIQLLERDNKIQLLWMNILIAAFASGAGLFALFYYLRQQREKKKKLVLDLEIDQLTTKNRELSEKYKDMLASVNAKSIESSDQRLLKRAIEVVENNLGDPLFGVEQMAKEMGMSRTNMHRKIKAITGFPPSELIRNIRLRKAAALLLSKADSVSQISFTVGFEDHSYFSKSFKKQFGVTPSEYVQSKDHMN